MQKRTKRLSTHTTWFRRFILNFARKLMMKVPKRNHRWQAENSIERSFSDHLLNTVHQSTGAIDRVQSITVVFRVSLIRPMTKRPGCYSHLTRVHLIFRLWYIFLSARLWLWMNPSEISECNYHLKSKFFNDHLLCSRYDMELFLLWRRKWAFTSLSLSFCPAACMCCDKEEKRNFLFHFIG